MSAFLKNLPVMGDLAAGVYLSEAPCFEVVKKFCRFEIWSNTQCINPVNALYITRSPTPLLRTE
jgi:hypothetical protein